ncbi:MAG: RNA polymerase sigma factor [Gammaproteobacteria bacterium]|nr:RNA polymerase sigma factor [Gammaproteobacteria bacterium]
MQDESLDQKSIFSVFTEYKSSLARVVKRYLRKESDVDDILQEAFLQTYAADRSTPIQLPKVYLFKTTKNLAVRENSKISTKLTEYIEDSGDSVLISDDKDAFELLSEQQEQKLLLEAIALLPEQCQRVTKLRLINGVRIKDIAVMLNISVSTTEKHIAKGLERCDEYVRQALSTAIQQKDNVDNKQKQSN